MTINLVENGDDLYQITLDDCGHRFIWSTNQIWTGASNTRFDLKNGTKEDFYYCEECASPREQKFRYGREAATADPNQVVKSSLRRVRSARKLNPLENKIFMANNNRSSPPPAVDMRSAADAVSGNKTVKEDKIPYYLSLPARMFSSRQQMKLS